MTRAQLKFTAGQIRLALKQGRRVTYGHFSVGDVKIRELELMGLLSGLSMSATWFPLDPALVMVQVTPPSAAPFRSQIEHRYGKA